MYYLIEKRKKFMVQRVLLCWFYWFYRFYWLFFNHQNKLNQWNQLNSVSPLFIIQFFISDPSNSVFRENIKLSLKKFMIIIDNVE
jgi:hypothetical protein